MPAETHFLLLSSCPSAVAGARILWTVLALEPGWQRDSRVALGPQVGHKCRKENVSALPHPLPKPPVLSTNPEEGQTATEQRENLQNVECNYCLAIQMRCFCTKNMTVNITGSSCDNCLRNANAGPEAELFLQKTKHATQRPRLWVPRPIHELWGIWQ